MKKVLTKSEAETLHWSTKLAGSLKGGQVISLEGDLGAGKTVVVKGIAKGLGLQEIVNSPTFVLMKVYKLPGSKIKQLVHVDAYRLNGAHELLEIGLADYLGHRDSLVLIEWGDKVKEILPKKYTTIAIKQLSENSRGLTIL